MSKPSAAAVKAPATETKDIAEKVAELGALPMVALLGNQLWPREAGIRFTTWEVVPDKGTPFEHLLRPSYWANVATKLKPGDEIVAFPRDGAWKGHIIVWDCGASWAHVSGGKIDRPAFDGAPNVEAEFDVFRDPIDGWSVKRRATGAVLSKNHGDAEKARAWIVEHQRALRA